nr:DEAD/DEAH box helicase [Boudabousia tangfeifanii]
MNQYLETEPQDFLAVATPGAGKTTFALRIAAGLLADGVVEKVTVVCPTEHLKNQWAEAAARVGIQLDPAFTNAQRVAGEHFDGVAVTYAQVGANPQVHLARTQAERTLVILDEIHHGGDSLTWGDGIGIAFAPATRRLALTGTPFRSDTAPIPFVRYAKDEQGIRRSQADYTYGYAEALRDGVVRPVIFLSYSGSMHWRTSAGDEVAARLGEPLTKDMTKQAWRTALDPKGQWMPAVLAAADQRLTQVRRSVPDAGGLVIASNQTAARAYAKQLKDITGVSPTVVLSDEAAASAKIDEFSNSKQRWLVAVRMVSEGVDVPRLAVGVYATSTSTPLFFAQAVGRFVRARKRGETASVFLPSVQPLLELAAQLEAQRDHALDRPTTDGGSNPEDLELARAQKAETASADLLPGYEALGAEAEFDGVLFDGNQFGLGGEVGSLQEQDFLGIPGLLEPEQVADVLRQHQRQQMKVEKQQRKAADVAKANREANANLSAHRLRAAKRKELQNLVASWSRRTGEAHALIHSQLRHATGGPEVAQASTEVIQARIDLVRKWHVGQR